MKLRRGFLVVILACFFFLPACDVAGMMSSVGGSNTSVGGNLSEWGDYTGEHVDSDNDGYCDDCSESVTVDFDVFAINDLHGKFEDSSVQPGVDEMSTYLSNAKAANENTIILSSGDMWQGSPSSNLTRGAMITEWMNEMGFVSMTLGNHEYDWGEKYIEDNAALANFPMLGINVYDVETNKIVDYCQPSVVVEKNGVKVGIIGAEGNVHSSISADKGEGVTFKTGKVLTNLVKQESDRLRMEGVDCIIYSLHDGTTDDYDHYDESLSSGGYVDIVFEAHTHASYVEKDAYGVYHVQGGGDNYKGLSHAKIAVNYVTSSAKVKKAEVVEHMTYTGLDDHPVVKTLTEKYAEQIAPAYEVLGENSKKLYAKDILSVCAMQYYKAGEEKWGKDYPIVLGGGYMNLRSPGYLHTGTVIYGDLMNLLPFDNELVLCSIKGSKLLSNFINTTNSAYYVYYGEYGNSIKNNVDPDATYYVVVDRYSSTYNPNGLTEIECYDTTTFARDLYAQYIREGGLGGSITPSTNDAKGILDAAYSLAPNTALAGTYTLSGKITQINDAYSTQYKNITVTIKVDDDPSGRSILCFRIKGEGAETLAVGDTITVTGKIVNYKGTVEFDTGSTIDKISKPSSGDSDETQTPVVSTAEHISISKALEIGGKLAGGAETSVRYRVYGEILSIDSTTYGSMTIADEEGNELYIYGTYAADGTRFDAFEVQPQVGDTVVLESTIKNYVNKSGVSLIEFGKSTLVATVSPISEVIDVGGDLDANAESEESYAVMGKVIGIANETYGNMTIEDSEGSELYIYSPRNEQDKAYSTFPKVGDTVIFCGKIKNYVDKNNNVTIELFHPLISWTGRLETSGDGEQPPVSGDCENGHADSNDDDSCDRCQTDLSVILDFFAVNDLHGKFDNTASDIGVDELTTYLKDAKTGNPYTIIFSSGDMWQGSAASNLTEGNIVTEWMNEVGFVSMTLGNHEYDWGRDAIEGNLALAEFPFLAINVYDNGTDKLADYCRPSVLIDKGEVQIGIIGAIGNVHSSISGEMNKDVTFKVGRELTELVKAESTRLRAAGADVIVYSIHDGTTDEYEHYDDSLSSGGYVDIVFEGHTHQRYANRDSYGVWHVQGGGDNKAISHAELTINYVTGSVEVLNAEYINNTVYESLQDDPIVEELKTKYETVMAPAYEELGENVATRDEDSLREICAKLYYQAGNARWGSNYNLVLGGGYMSVRAPYYLYSGAVYYADLMNLLPFDNQLVLCSISGSDLKKNFLTAKKNYFVYLGTYGNSIASSVDDNATYYLITDTYSSTYAPNNLTEIERYGEGTYARDLLADYIKKGGLTNNPPADPAEKFPEGETVLELQTITIAEALALGASMTNNGEYTAQEYYIVGRLEKVSNIEYGNLNIRDEAGNSLYIYGTYDKVGNAYGSMANLPFIGDLIKVRSKVGKYNDKPQLKNAVIEEITSVRYTQKTVDEAVAIGKALQENAISTEYYAVTGTIVEVQNATYGNVVIEDSTGAQMYVYGIANAYGVRYDKLTQIPVVGDLVCLYGMIKNFPAGDPEIRKIQLYNSAICDFAPATSIIGAKAILTELTAEEGKQTLTNGLYKISGKITRIVDENLGSMWIADEDGNELYLWCLFQKDVYYSEWAEKPAVGDSVTVYGDLYCATKEGVRKEGMYGPTMYEYAKAE